jgi:hypothetical protein
MRAELLVLLFLSQAFAWKAGLSYDITGQVSVNKGEETVFNVTVNSPCLDFTWKVKTQGEQITVHFMEEVHVVDNFTHNQYQWLAYQENNTFEFDDWLSVVNETFDPRVEPAR